MGTLRADHVQDGFVSEGASSEVSTARLLRRRLYRTGLHLLLLVLAGTIATAGLLLAYRAYSELGYAPVNAEEIPDSGPAFSAARDALEPLRSMDGVETVEVWAVHVTDQSGRPTLDHPFVEAHVTVDSWTSTGAAGVLAAAYDASSDAWPEADLRITVSAQGATVQAYSASALTPEGALALMKVAVTDDIDDAVRIATEPLARLRDDRNSMQATVNVGANGDRTDVESIWRERLNLMTGAPVDLLVL